MSAMNELEIVERLCRCFPTNSCVRLGPGDDAAILETSVGAETAGTSQIVVSVDMLTEGVDFLLNRMNPQIIARKALNVNLSDLAAMAAEPMACVISVALPRNSAFPLAEDFSLDKHRSSDGERFILPKNETPAPHTTAELMEALSKGFREAAEEHNIAIVGGDTNMWDEGLAISVTVLGRVVKKALRRDSAQIGDAICVTGALGGSILRRQFSFVPRVREMLLLNDKYDIHAAMDISDGLALDISRLVKSSRLGAVVDIEAVPIHPDAVELSALRCDESLVYDWIPQTFAQRTPIEHALGDGEDFEILFTTTPESAREMRQNPFGIPITQIGRIIETPGIFAQRGEEELYPLPPSGFVHDAK
ncbi:MAG: thiamine-phosphate kinase [Planctomycetia bacterium]|nr:thiamine-phosphate kinase [Planctomycetia bacterium]